jgi:hypothetical protein
MKRDERWIRQMVIAGESSHLGQSARVNFLCTILIEFTQFFPPIAGARRESQTRACLCPLPAHLLPRVRCLGSEFAAGRGRRFSPISAQLRRLQVPPRPAPLESPARGRAPRSPSLGRARIPRSALRGPRSSGGLAPTRKQRNAGKRALLFGGRRFSALRGLA